MTNVRGKVNEKAGKAELEGKLMVMGRKKDTRGE